MVGGDSISEKDWNNNIPEDQAFLHKATLGIIASGHSDSAYTIDGRRYNTIENK
jgi:hypothetical protein